jgi:hypothetical protein
MDQGIIFALTPEVDACGDALLDLFGLYAPVFASEDAGHEDQWALGVPFAFAYSSGFGCH